MKTVRWGLMSTANINRALIPVIRASRRGELAAVASRDASKARAYAAQWSIPKWFGSYGEMLASGAVDVVYVSLPNHLHAEWSIQAMEAGVHVLCEKPFALTLEDVDAMIDAQKRTGTVLAEAIMYRHHPQTRAVGEWIRSGRLGEVALTRAVFDFSFRTRRNIRLVPQYGGGSLWDVGVYPVSFAQMVMGGAPESVVGRQWLGDQGVDETFAGQLHYGGDRFAQIASAFRTPWYTMAEVIGTEGRLHLNRPFTFLQDDRRLVFYPKEGEPETVFVPEQPLYAGQVEDMHACILDGAAPYISLQETRDHVRTVLALYASARSGQVESL